MFVEKNAGKLSLGKYNRKRAKSKKDPWNQKDSEINETPNVEPTPIDCSFPWGRGSLKGTGDSIRVPGGPTMDSCVEPAPVSTSYPWGRGVLKDGESFRGPGGRGVGAGHGRGGSSRSTGGERGRHTFRGDNRGWGSGVRGQDTFTEGKGSQSLFLEPVIHAYPKFRGSDYKRSLLVSNLPTIMVKDCQDISSFIAKCTNVNVEKLFYKTDFDKSDLLAAVCMFENEEHLPKIMDDLHGKVFNDHHLIVDRFHERNNEYITEHCVKVSNLSTAVSVETLWKLFESCGKLGMIYLNREKSEALVNFEVSGSVIEALKFDGENLDETNIKVVKLERKLSMDIRPSDDLQSMLKDFRISHIKYCVGKKNVALGGTVFFPDRETYSKALNLNGKDWNGHKIVVKPSSHIVYIANPDQNLKREDIITVFGTDNVKFHPRKYGVEEIHFDSKLEADTALKASPVLVKNQLVTVWDDVSKIPSLTEKFEDVKVEDEAHCAPSEEEDDNVLGEANFRGEVDVEKEEEDKDDEAKEDDVSGGSFGVGVGMREEPKPSHNVKKQKEQQPSHTRHKRKRKDNTALKKRKTMHRRNE